MRYRHEKRHYHADTGKYNVESERKRHLRAGGNKIVHKRMFTKKELFMNRRKDS